MVGKSECFLDVSFSTALFSVVDSLGLNMTAEELVSLSICGFLSRKKGTIIFVRWCFAPEFLHNELSK